MKLQYLSLLLVIFSFENCSPWKKMQVDIGDKNDAIKNAIIDFVNSNNLSEADNFFSVTAQDINNDILGVKIYNNKNKITVFTENEIDYSYRAFPTDYFEQNEKFFYWKDSTKETTIDIIAKLTKLNRVDTTIQAKFYPERIYGPNRQKALHYYFCKKNLKQYKKIYSRIAMGWYAPPKINCQ